MNFSRLNRTFVTGNAFRLNFSPELKFWAHQAQKFFSKQLSFYSAKLSVCKNQTVVFQEDIEDLKSEFVVVFEVSTIGRYRHFKIT